jgi:hypothetical protein
VDWGFENKKIDPLKSEELLKYKNGPLADLPPRQTPGALAPALGDWRVAEPECLSRRSEDGRSLCCRAARECCHQPPTARGCRARGRGAEAELRSRGVRTPHKGRTEVVDCGRAAGWPVIC